MFPPISSTPYHQTQDLTKPTKKLSEKLPLELWRMLFENYFSQKELLPLREVSRDLKWLIDCYLTSIYETNNLATTTYTYPITWWYGLPYFDNKLQLDVLKLSKQPDVFLLEAPFGIIFIDRINKCIYYWGALNRDMPPTIRSKPTLLLRDISIKAIVSDPGKNCTFLIDETDRVFAYGDNDYGQLGVGNADSQSIPSQSDDDYEPMVFVRANPQTITPLITPQQVTGLDDIIIERIITNGKTTFFIARNGRVFACGENGNGQLGVGIQSAAILTPNPIVALSGHRIGKIFAFDIYTFFVTQEGKVFACGQNAHGELGLRHSTSPVTIPQPIIGLSNYIIVDIIVANFCSFFLTQEGKVFACGKNSADGVLGVRHSKPTNNPEQILALNGYKIVKVFTTGFVSFFVTQAGKVFACGSNGKGQLGIGKSYPHITAPEPVVGLDGIVIERVVINGNSTFFMAHDGWVYGSGDNQFGQLGIDSLDNNTYVPKPVVITGNLPIRNITSYIDTDATLFIARNGNTFVCGFNGDKRLGTTSKKPYVITPKQLNILGSPVTKWREKYRGNDGWCMTAEECMYVINSSSKALKTGAYKEVFKPANLSKNFCYRQFEKFIQNGLGFDATFFYSATCYLSCANVSILLQKIKEKENNISDLNNILQNAVDGRFIVAAACNQNTENFYAILNYLSQDQLNDQIKNIFSHSDRNATKIFLFHLQQHLRITNRPSLVQALQSFFSTWS